jgi:rhodanese-related sulfurtransferase
MNIRRIAPEDAHALIDANEAMVYLDVRTPGEFELGHVPQAINVPVVPVV